MKYVTIPERSVHPTDLLAESIELTHTVWLALNADREVVDDDAITSMRSVLWNAMNMAQMAMNATIGGKAEAA